MNFIIVSQARSGSSLLAEMLNSHSNIHCDGEIFNRKKVQKKWGKLGLLIADYWPELILWYQSRKKKKKYYGFKLLVNQIKNPEKFIDSLHKKGFIILDLRRNNVIKKAFSAAISVTTGRWSVQRKEDRSNTPIEINPDLLLQRIALIEKENKRQDKLVAEKNSIRILYETDLMDEEKQANFSKHFCEQIQLPIEPMQAECIKTDEKPLEDRITNYHELINLIQNSRFAHYLNN